MQRYFQAQTTPAEEQQLAEALAEKHDLTAEERKTIHGHNERVRIDCAHRAIEFYIRLMKSL